MPRRSSVSVGLFAHNEEATVAQSIAAVLDQRIDDPDLTVDSVTVVSSGSTDGTDAIARAFVEHDARVRVLSSPVRDGKARAINRFLAESDADVYVIVSADAVLEQGALSALLRPLRDPRVGMTGARPVPRDDPRGVGSLVRVLWELHDRVAREAPKLGEAIAVRGPCPPIADGTRADEASLESHVTRERGLVLAYCPDAVAYIHGPTTLADYVEQRTRIAAAHAEIERGGYRPATRDLGRVVRHTLRYLVERPTHAPTLAAAALLEAFCWARGSALARTPPLVEGGDGLWRPIASAKRTVTRPLAAAESPTPLAAP